jgi:hypothetical protein
MSKELQSIVNYEVENPAVSRAFNTSCAASCTVKTCRCTATATQSAPYWSSTTLFFDPLRTAWSVDFVFGVVHFFSQNEFDGLHVRAVRP